MTANGSTAPFDHLDVIIVGAGLSGIGAACHLQAESPGKTFALLESRDAIGGTWDLFRYPGIRSDSDMFTLGYSFRPWEEAKALADGPSILEYVRATARDHDVERHIRFHHRVVRAEWSTPEARWTVEAERTDTGETVHLTCGFLLGCTGYYRYEEGYTPDFPGRERFTGRVVHPQHWPADLDHTGKRVVVIGSGATAVTLVPAMAADAAHVTMLQRSPSYIVALPSVDPIADFLRRRLPAKAAYSIARWKNVIATSGSFHLSRRFPQFMRRVFRKGVERSLPADFDIDTHFNPRYSPWDQRVCLAPDGDLFAALRSGAASIVTDTVETFTETGVRTGAGEEIEADVIVTATGLNMLMFGGTELVVDGRVVDVPTLVGYKGIMFSDVPNLAMCVGYTNASWTLKSDLTCEYVCRILNHMDANGYDECVPRWPEAERPSIPMIDLTSGYVLRALASFPKQGPTPPWRLYQNYARDIRLLRRGAIEDGVLEFSSLSPAARPAEPLPA